MNRLSKETSPYLLQHAHNPVDWYPWGTEALDRARRESKPIFLSIGYSACHWCHVMEKESFEDEATAKILNEKFVSIKVDREERPDLDHIYMSAVQMLTQHGGWPMSVFLTPELKPFYGGTYFPPEDRMGMPSFKKVLLGIANAWATRKEEVIDSAQKITEALQGVQRDSFEDAELPPLKTALNQVFDKITRNFDNENGGFGSQPKFFHTMDVRVSLRQSVLNQAPGAAYVATHTLNKWAGGGIYDHLAGGFHRYSTDAKWLVPHFEKMLYDNALVSEAYLEGYQLTKNPDYFRVATETLDYVLRQMTSSDGGFFSTEDADSEGVEGKFYVWTKTEIENVLDTELAALFCKVYGVTESGNWEGHSVLNIPRPLSELSQELGHEMSWLEDSLSVARRKLREARALRPAPFRDEKILSGWNGMMIHSLALGYQVSDDVRYLEAAQKAATLILSRMRIKDDRTGTPMLLHTYKDGRARLAGYLDDYAHLTNALVSLYESDFDEKWLTAAQEIAALMVSEFWDTQDGFHYTARTHETLVLRPKEHHDGATPSAVAMALTALARLGRLTSNDTQLKIVEQELKRHAQQMQNIPAASGQLWIAYDLIAGNPMEIVVSGPLEENGSTLLKTLRSEFLPGKIVARADAGLPLTEGKVAVNNEPTIYVCRNHSCRAPVTSAEDLLKELRA